MNVASLRWEPRLLEDLRSPNHSALREPRQGICLHYDASTTDKGAVSWFKHPDCRVSYQLLVLDSGDWVRIAPDDRRAWHAGRCKPGDDQLQYSDANSALYGIAAATNNKVDVTPVQLLTIAYLCKLYFAAEQWSLEQLWRITGHEHEAWPRGRKSDPSGGDPHNPIFSVDQVRELVPLIQS
jgi:N-acetyl-anhydromuramyl-L-alanine amidase AmpD